MTRPDLVFARFVEANPVPEPESVPVSVPTADEILRGFDIVPGSPAANARAIPSRWRWVAAVASFLLVVSVGIAVSVLRGGGEGDVARDAVSTAERWLEAVNEGDVDTAMALSTPSSSRIADRRVNEWVAGFAAQGMPNRVLGCVFVETTADIATVECQVRLTDPVAVELEVSQLVAPFVYEDGLVAWQPYRGDDISQVNAAYSAYLQLFHEGEYEMVCSPDAYAPGTVVADRRLALTGECADMAAPLADEVAGWIRDGRPVPAG